MICFFQMIFGGPGIDRENGNGQSWELPFSTTFSGEHVTPSLKRTASLSPENGWLQLMKSPFFRWPIWSGDMLI